MGWTMTEGAQCNYMIRCFLCGYLEEGDSSGHMSSGLAK